jgi:uncharacterized protein YbjT (DUF2867 family)
LDWTIVRCSFFSQNFDEGAWLDEVLAGAVSLAVDDLEEPFVDADDIADVVVAALTDDRHVGQLYELTVPRGCCHSVTRWPRSATVSSGHWVASRRISAHMRARPR